MKNYLGKEEFEDEQNKEILQKVGAGNKQKAIIKWLSPAKYICPVW